MFDSASQEVVYDLQDLNLGEIQPAIAVGRTKPNLSFFSNELPEKVDHLLR